MNASDEPRADRESITEAVDDPQIALQLRRRAMDLLARREHSRYELKEKLRSRFPDTSDQTVRGVLEQLEADNLLSDSRFAESYVRMRRDRGYGPLYILSQFAKRGVDPVVAEAVLDRDDEQWAAVAEDVLRRKAGGEMLADSARQKAKWQRFLASRGFTAEQSYKALNRLGESSGQDG